MSLATLILNKIDEDKHQSPLCPLCKTEPHITTPLFNCTKINTHLKVTDLWTDPVEVENLLAEWKGRLLSRWAWMPTEWGNTICRRAQNRIVGPLHHYRWRDGIVNTYTYYLSLCSRKWNNILASVLLRF